MFYFGILNVYRYQKEWYIAFRCSCNQCYYDLDEATVWKHPFRVTIPR